MDLNFLMISFALAVITGAIAITIITRLKPDWTLKKRLLVAVLILPGLSLLAAGGGALAILASDADRTMRDLAAASILRMGAISALVALAGGMIGVSLRLRGIRR
jgi:hypothetical protein